MNKRKATPATRVIGATGRLSPNGRPILYGQNARTLRKRKTYAAPYGQRSWMPR